jgi:hypothetical protein
MMSQPISRLRPIGKETCEVFASHPLDAFEPISFLKSADTIVTDMAGIVLQQLFICVCIIISVRLYNQARKDKLRPPTSLRRLALPLWASLVLITVIRHFFEPLTAAPAFIQTSLNRFLSKTLARPKTSR